MDKEKLDPEVDLDDTVEDVPGPTEAIEEDGQVPNGGGH
jgi:hypothetical protein